LRLLALIPIAAAAGAETIDRIAVALGNRVITQGAVVEQVRVAGFLNRTPLALDPASMRRMAERMIEQQLLRREMESSRFPTPSEDEAKPMIEKIKRDQYPSEADYRAELAKYGIGEEALVRNLVAQLVTLRFVELRFRPSNTVTEGEIEIYYRDTYTPRWEKTRPNSEVPVIEDARDEIEQILLQEKIDQAMSEWLKAARGSARVRYFDEAFR